MNRPHQIIPRESLASPRVKKPEWLKVRRDHTDGYRELKRIMRDLDLNTVCEEARCPNIYECWQQRTATFMILGDTCTRACRFCAVNWGRPTHLDRDEPKRVARAVAAMGLRHAVITSVNRDELEDGGAEIFAETICEIRSAIPDCGIEVLIPDFKGDKAALQKVIDAGPEVISHNIETVPRLFRQIQPWSSFERGMTLLERIKDLAPEIVSKTGLMVGLGEEFDEVVAVMRELAAIGVEVVTIGQYLPPSQRHAPLDRYYTPDEFAALKREGEAAGISHVESGPLVRSSYHAGDQYEELRNRSRARLAS
ncbi:MAG: lipoyl synthase [Thermomicrobiales bacterium]